MGECRRFAPRETQGSNDRETRWSEPDRAVWPVTSEIEGCGEHEAVTPKEAV
jgi:hypothetical protein